MATGILSNRTFLMHSTDGSSYTKLVDVLDFGDLGGTPETIEITTLSDMERKYINGIKSQEPITFTALYNTTDFAAVKALEGSETYWGVYFGGSDESTPTGANGKFTFKGEVSVFVNGASSNEAVNMTITISPSTKVTFAAS